LVKNRTNITEFTQRATHPFAYFGS